MCWLQAAVAAWTGLRWRAGCVHSNSVCRMINVAACACTTVSVAPPALLGGAADSAVLRRAGAGAPQPAQARDWRGGLCAEQAIELLRDFYAAGNPKGARAPAQPPALRLWSASPELSRPVLWRTLDPDEWALAPRPPGSYRAT